MRNVTFQRVYIPLNRRVMSNTAEKRKLRDFPFYAFDTIWKFYRTRLLIVNTGLIVGILGYGSYIYYKTDHPATLLPLFDSPEKLILKSFEEGRGFNSFKDKER